MQNTSFTWINNSYFKQFDIPKIMTNPTRKHSKRKLASQNSRFWSGKSWRKNFWKECETQKTSNSKKNLDTKQKKLRTHKIVWEKQKTKSGVPKKFAVGFQRVMYEK